MAKKNAKSDIHADHREGPEDEIDREMQADERENRAFEATQGRGENSLEDTVETKADALVEKLAQSRFGAEINDKAETILGKLIVLDRNPYPEIEESEDLLKLAARKLAKAGEDTGTDPEQLRDDLLAKKFEAALKKILENAKRGGRSRGGDDDNAE